MKTYTRQAVLKTIDKYINELDGELHIIDENSVLLDFRLAVLTAPKYRSIVIQNQYLNEWSSAYTVRQYKKLPNKYKDAISKL
jgi:hypothetical protein